MAEIRTVVTLDRREIDDCLIELAKKQLDKCIGGSSIQYDIHTEASAAVQVADLLGATITFMGKVRT